MTPNNGEMLSSGNGMEQQLPPQINTDVERLRDDFRTFIADCQTLLRNAGNLSGEGAALARQELSRRMADAQVRLGDFRQTANDQAMRLRTTTEDYVRREPFKAVGIAAGVGALIALVVARR
jgi:ElaB/YqjD/DUF883 family membrane-anchored ribosome-binding protein